jgi:precorrin-6B methylase 2
MKYARPFYLLCVTAFGLAACQRQEPSRSAEQSAASTPPALEPGPGDSATRGSNTDPSSTPSPHLAIQTRDEPSAPSTTPVGTPVSPPDASKGPAAPAADAAEPARTPDVVYVPTPQPVVDRMLKMAQVKKSDVVYDLGCGDGRIVVTAAKRYGARAYGYDIDPQRVTEAKANVKAAGVEDLVTIEQKDIFTLDLSPASVVTLYLLPKLNVRLIPQLEKLKPGSRIVSHDFNMEGVKPLQVATLRPAGEAEDHHIYFWKTPLVRE